MPVRAHSAVKCVTISHTGIIWVKNEKLQMYIPQDISLIKNSRGNCRCIRKGSDSSQCILILHQRILVTGQDFCLNIMKNNRKSFILVLKIIFQWKYPLIGGISSLPVPQTEPTCSLWNELRTDNFRSHSMYVMLTGSFGFGLLHYLMSYWGCATYILCFIL